ncbi:cell division protein FtsA [Candidatus Methylacidithermus pantelleriae]|uniref:Cell division protein FtsA n=1 Tax=Candidatus Methylacidithermus pantelleriae TaxID=2744239 RepID=A0A8J2BSF1_9BACT|nr:cell division protein FtsA [Candidatus Methylacidithermus pantelleriae]CAF0694997.1 Cell division protein FtsA [Candidatus Methylacidithermus pantelleriae]
MFWKKDTDILVAMEIGSSKVAVAVGELRTDSNLTLLGVGERPSSQVRKREIVDFEIAQRCVHDAIVDAEEKTDTAVKEVYLAISGAHVRSTNRRVTLALEGGRTEIENRHVEQLRKLARQLPLPAGYVLLHDLLQQYSLDDGSVTLNPVGLCSKRLTADYHLVFGIATRLQTTIRCVKELSIEVKNYALSSYATAQAVLLPDQKEMGAMVIDCGAGVTDYIVYVRGSVVHSGILGVGGDHLTNDLAVGLGLPFATAEELKKTHGSVVASTKEKRQRVVIPPSPEHGEIHVRKEAIVTILRARQQEIFEIIREDVESQPFWSGWSGQIFVTGGGSLLPGIEELATEVFRHPVERAVPVPMDGDQELVRRPQLATVLGLLQYARVAELQEIPSRGWRSRFQRVLAGMRLF